MQGQFHNESDSLTTYFAIVELFMFDYNKNFLCVFDNSYLIINDLNLDATSFFFETSFYWIYSSPFFLVKELELFCILVNEL